MSAPRSASSCDSMMQFCWGPQTAAGVESMYSIHRLIRSMRRARHSWPLTAGSSGIDESVIVGSDAEVVLPPFECRDAKGFLEERKQVDGILEVSLRSQVELVRNLEFEGAERDLSSRRYVPKSLQTATPDRTDRSRTSLRGAVPPRHLGRSRWARHSRASRACPRAASPVPSTPGSRGPQRSPLSSIHPFVRGARQCPASNGHDQPESRRIQRRRRDRRNRRTTR